MKRINKTPGPNELTKFAQHNPDAKWYPDFKDSHGGKDYQARRKRILDDQRGLCAYCEIEIINLLPHKQRVEELTVTAWLWARTVKSPNPAFSHVDVPLVRSFVISSKKGKEAWVKPVIENDKYRFEVRSGKQPSSAIKGESETGRLLSRMADKGEAIRQPAYHLYTLCERKKWAEDARAYNELISSWHAIVDAAGRVDQGGEQLEFGF